MALACRPCAGLLLTRSVVSSANIMQVVSGLLVLVGKSFVNDINSIGPRTDH